jgi:putative SOS response-associated peptidase YedK
VLQAGAGVPANGGDCHSGNVCGRFSLHDPVPDLVAEFAIDEVRVDDPLPHWNIAPTQPVLAVATSRDGSSRRLGELRWGLVPWWADDPSIGNRLINARAETLRTSRAFRAAFERRRCLIPASGFFEWQRVEGATGRRGARRPFYVHAADGTTLALGGLWEVWHDAEGRSLRTCTIVTTAPNRTVAPVHDRMPLVLPTAAWDRWLAPSALSDDEAARFLTPAPDDLLSLYPVSDRVNSPKEDSPELIEPLPAPSEPGPG